MKAKSIWTALVSISIVLVISLVSLVFAQGSSDSQPDGSPNRSAPAASEAGTDSNPSDTPEVLIPRQYQTSEANAPNAVAAATVYFTPQDENTSTTVMFLYNTSDVTATVGIETFRLDGTQFLNTSVDVPPSGLVRISGDTVSTVSGTWQNVVLVNFTTFSTYGKMTMPAGVKADGYVVWNNSGTYDPLQIAPTLPLRFSTDPPSVFLPTVNN